MPYNIELFKQINEIISAQPNRHDQESWESQSSACGTTRCVAGWAVHLAVKADLFTLDDDWLVITSPEVRAFAAQQNLGEPAETGGLIPRLARELLGLTRDEADRLFYADNEPARRAVEKAAAGDRHGFLLALNEREAE